MRIVADTNILLRAALADDPRQSPKARRLLEESEVVVVSRHALCEFVWVLSQSYKLANDEIYRSVRALLGAANVITGGDAIEEGLKTIRAGGDFADGVIAYEGRWLGGETFVSFDKKAVAVLKKQGHAARLLT